MLRDLPSDARAPGVARAGLRFVAAGIPEALLDEGELLISELVTASVRGAGDVSAGRIGVSIEVGRDTLRVEVIDAPETPASSAALDEANAYGMVLVSGLASRWGGGSERGRRVAWFELDLPSPGGTAG